MKYLDRGIHYFASALLGLSIPAIYLVHEMLRAEMTVSFSSLIELITTYTFYLTGIVFFPLLGIFIAELVRQIQKKNNIIKEEFDYLKVLLNATPDAIIFLNENQEIIFQNNQFNLLFSKYENILKDTAIKSFFDQVEFIQQEVSVDSTILPKHPFLMSFKLIKFRNRKNYLISFQDLKSLRDKETIIEDQKSQMIEKNKLASLGEMAAGIAHEINNPLTVIHSNNSIIERLLEKSDTELPKVNLLIDKTRQQISRITTIITSLRNLSRGMANEEFELFRLDQVIEEVVSLAKIRDKSRKVIYQFNNKPANVYGNRGQIVQVLLNLLNNAIDAIATMDDPWISLEILESGKYVELYITDSGEGIHKDIVDKIFLPMYTTKEIGKGTGLGLSLSKTFVEQNSGTIEYLQGRRNTCFKVSLLKDENSMPKITSTYNAA